MQQLHLVGVTTESDGLIFSPRRGSRSGGYVVAIDEALIEALEQAARLRATEEQSEEPPAQRVPRLRHDRPESMLTPREMQARLRAGHSIAEVARAAQVEEEWVARFAVPVMAEQQRVVEMATGLTSSKPRLGPSAMPLGDSVRANLYDRGIPYGPDNAGWDAYTQDGTNWIVRFTYVSRRRQQVGEWEVDRASGSALPRNRVATDLGYVDSARRRRGAPPVSTAPDPEPGEAEESDGRQRRSGAGRRPARRSARKAPAARKTTARRAPARKAGAKKATSKRPTAKRAAAKKAAAKKTTSKRTTAKKAASKRTASKKATARKAVARKKATPRKVAVRKVRQTAASGVRTRASAAKKGSARRAPARKAAAARTQASTTAKRRAGAGKRATRPATARKTTARKTGASKTTASKTTARKTTPARASTAARRAPTPRRAPARKSTATRSPARRPTPVARSTQAHRLLPQPGTRRPRPLRAPGRASAYRSPGVEPGVEEPTAPVFIRAQVAGGADGDPRATAANGTSGAASVRRPRPLRAR